MLQTYRDPPYHLPVPKTSTSMLLSDETKADLRFLSEHYRIPLTGAMEMSVAAMARAVRAEQAHVTTAPPKLTAPKKKR